MMLMIIFFADKKFLILASSFFPFRKFAMLINVAQFARVNECYVKKKTKQKLIRTHGYTLINVLYSLVLC